MGESLHGHELDLVSLGFYLSSLISHWLFSVPQYCVAGSFHFDPTTPHVLAQLKFQRT